MIKYEYNEINHEPYIRITSTLKNYNIKIKDSEEESTNEIMVKGTTTGLEFEEVYIKPEGGSEE